MTDNGKRRRRGGQINRRGAARITDAHKSRTAGRRGTHRVSRSPRPPVENGNIAASRALADKFTKTLRVHRAELRKVRSQTDEILQMLNAGADPESCRDIIETAAQQWSVTFQRLNDDLRNLQNSEESRAMGIEPWGSDR